MITLGFWASIILTILKCCGVVGMAWWLVWAPLWGSIALTIILVVLGIKLLMSEWLPNMLSKLFDKWDKTDW